MGYAFSKRRPMAQFRLIRIGVVSQRPWMAPVRLIWSMNKRKRAAASGHG